MAASGALEITGHRRILRRPTATRTISPFGVTEVVFGRLSSFAQTPEACHVSGCTLFSMNALLDVDGSCFQAVSNEAFLRVEATKHQFHPRIHGEGWILVINGEEHAPRAVVQLEKHRADTAQ